MITLVERHRDQIAALCRKYGVRTLELFGSAARGIGDAVVNDIDFLFEFDDDTERLSDRFFGLSEDLERLLGKPVDLVSSRDLRNPFFIESVNRKRVALYAA